MGGDHGHGHGHGPPYVVPDYRIYKIEDAPLLQQTQKALAAQGLKDPWIRNEIWRYNRPEYGTVGSRAYMVLFRGFKYGFAAFVATMVGTAIYDKVSPPKHGHGEHGHH